MTPLALFKKLRAAGMDEETALAMAEEFEKDGPSAPIVDDALARKRAYDRERQARLRAEKVVRDRTMSHDSYESPDVVRVVTTSPSAKDAHARVEDIYPTVVDNNYYTTPNRASDRDWKVRANLEWLDAQLREAGGPAIANPAISPGLMDLSIITGLLTGGTGPPCDLEADVLPVIRARCVGRKPGSVRGWNLFREAIREARDRRLTGAPAVEPVHQGNRHERPDQPSAKLAAKQANLERAFRGAQSAANRRAI